MATETTTAKRTLFEHVEHGIEFPELTETSVLKERHYIVPHGKVYPSITTVVSLLERDAIRAWRERVGYKEADKVMRYACNRGHALHSCVERFLQNKPPFDERTIPLTKYLFGALGPVLEKRLGRIWCQEQRLFSHHLRLAGRCDLIAELDGELAVCDFKTSNSLKPEEWIRKYYCQTYGYACMFQDITGKPINRVAIFMVSDEGETCVYEKRTIEDKRTYLSLLLQARNQYEREKREREAAIEAEVGRYENL